MCDQSTTRKRKEIEEVKTLHLTVCNYPFCWSTTCKPEQEQYVVRWSLVKDSIIEKQLTKPFVFLRADMSVREKATSEEKELKAWIDNVVESEDAVLIFSNQQDGHSIKSTRV